MQRHRRETTVHKTVFSLTMCDWFWYVLFSSMIFYQEGMLVMTYEIDAMTY